MAVNVPIFDSNEEKLFEEADVVLVNSKINSFVNTRIDKDEITVLYKDSVTKKHMIATILIDSTTFSPAINHIHINKNLNGKYITSEEIYDKNEFNNVVELLQHLFFRGKHYIVIGNINGLIQPLHINNLIKDFNLPHNHEYHVTGNSCSRHDSVNNDEFCYQCRRYKCCIEEEHPHPEPGAAAAKKKYLKYKQKYLQLKKQLKL